MSNAVNPMLQQLEQNTTNNAVNNITQLKQALYKLSNANNRDAFNAMAQNIIASNPKLRPYVQKYGTNFMQAFQDEAKNRGIDPDKILTALRN